MKTVPYGFCKCGCGELTRMASMTSTRHGVVRGQPQHYVFGHQRRQDLRARFDSKVDRSGGPDACWPWRGARDVAGYGFFRVGKIQRHAHRVAWELHHGTPPPKGMHVCHRCDNRWCMNAERCLFIGTPKDNALDMVAKGRQARGERNSKAKLTEASVRAIRESAAQGRSKRELAAAHGVGRLAVSRAISGATWRHVQ